jgi:hypothetical protein
MPSPSIDRSGGGVGVVLSEFLEDSESFAHFGVHGIGCLQEVEQLRVIHLEKHSSDFTGQIRLSTGRKELLAAVNMKEIPLELTVQFSYKSPRRAFAFVPWAMHWQAQQR